MTDHYATLGIARGATADEIKRAYRRLASQHHPDKGGSTQRFQEIEAAYRVLSDPASRAEYDNPRPQTHFHSTEFNLNEIFNMFGTRFHQEQRRATANLQLWITLADLCSPGPKIIAVSSPYGQSQIEIQIPPGLEDGDSIRYPRMAPGQQDLVITYRIRPDADWQRDGLHLITERTVDIWQAIQGTNIRIATLRDTEIELSIPPMTQNGTILRIKGHGLLAKNSTHSGDLMIKIMLRLPDSIPEGIMAEIQRMTPK